MEGLREELGKLSSGASGKLRREAEQKLERQISMSVAGCKSAGAREAHEVHAKRTQDARKAHARRARDSHEVLARCM